MIEVVAAIIQKEGKILIARRALHKSLGGKWEFPGGKVEENENHWQALERELLEEFGIQTKTKDHFMTNEHVYENFSIRLIAYFSDYLSGDFKLTDHDKIEWIEAYKLESNRFAAADIPIVERLQTEYKSF